MWLCERRWLPNMAGNSSHTLHTHSRFGLLAAAAAVSRLLLHRYTYAQMRVALYSTVFRSTFLYRLFVRVSVYMLKMSLASQQLTSALVLLLWIFFFFFIDRNYCKWIFTAFAFFFVRRFKCDFYLGLVQLKLHRNTVLVFNNLRQNNFYF